ncbi:MAG: dipeptide epimerase [Lactobacillus sp.]|jgi:L-alanine-DL-glutamate epimerase-like enolase superfamily enzyme|nr:dipeptide epimerase [Lactobacillus sp.]MCH3906145.1 dipeptide epimerase [Lactobacillus sp.]MCI1329486.1 dipeptide epimerase [Lactobacillus sp.]MCI1466663.1 dipeptide epimerase [Lactobacillus sp.]MCI1883382.1 dipeptide epimerase [Lactobacillus sp.]
MKKGPLTVSALIIKDLQIDHKSVPLKHPFVTALHRVDSIEAVRVQVVLSNGIVGVGTGTPNEKVTGDNLASSTAIVEQAIKPVLVGADFTKWQQLLTLLKNSVLENTPAKAAVELALYDARRQLYNCSLTNLLGGADDSVITDYTISIGEPAQMASEARALVKRGFTSLKIKLGEAAVEDNIAVIKSIAKAAGPDIHLRLDMNQTWTKRTTMQAAQAWQQAGLKIDFIEQPLAASDLAGMAWLTAHCPYPIMADESVHSYQDAQKVVAMQAADYINIKLMKTGGLSEAQKINDLAASHHIPTMLGCMIEPIESIAAACSFVLANPNVKFADLDSIFMAELDPDLSQFARCHANEIELINHD